MKWIFAVLLAFAIGMAPAQAFAADDEPDDLLLRIGSDVVIGPGEVVGAVIVIDGNLTIEGTVEDTALVIDGNAIVRGTVQEDLTVISGDIDLEAGAQVNNVTSIRGDLRRDSSAIVSGEINERDNFRFFQGIAAVFSILFWLAMSVAVIVSGLVFAAVGGRQLTEAMRVMTGDAVNTILGVVFVWVALPIVAVLALITVIGIPLGLGILLFLMPVLLFLGYIVAGAKLGATLTKLSGREAGGHPFLATFIGLVLLQAIILIPILGGLVAFLAGVWGSGALTVIAYRGAGFKGVSRSAPDTSPEAPAA